MPEVTPPGSLSRNVAQNTVVRLLSFGVGKLLLLAVTVYLARALGTEGFGQFAFVLAYLAFFWTLAEPGVAPILLQRIQAASPDDLPRVVGRALVLKAALAVFAVLLSWGAMFIVGVPPGLRLAAVVASLGILSSVSEVFATVFQARFVQKYNALAEVVEQSAFAALAVLLLAGGFGLYGVFVAVVGGQWTRLALIVLFSRRFVVPRLEVDLSDARDVMVRALPVFAMAVCTTVLAALDLLLLHRFVGSESVGHYSAAKRLVAPWGLLAGTYVAALYPLLHQLYHDRALEPFAQAYALSCKYLLAFTVPLATAVTLLAPQIISLLYGAEYAPAAAALAILIWTQVFLGAKMVNDYVFIAMGRQWLALALLVAVAVANALLNLALIPTHGHVGAAVAAVASFALYFVLELAVPAARPYAVAVAAYGWKPLVASAPLALFALLPLRAPAEWALLIAAPGVYVAGLLLLRGIDWSDLMRVRRLVVHQPQP